VYTAFQREPLKRYGASPAIWDHILPSTQHR